MPKVVDHDARRRVVTAAAAHLISEGGVDAVTVRELARATRCSTAVVSHYFKNKRELLVCTFREATDHVRTRLDIVFARDPGDLRGVLEAVLPLDEERRRDWSVWLAFWADAIADVELGGEQRQRVRDMREIVADVLRTSGRAPERVDAEARRLLTTVIGIAVQASFDPEEWPPDRQREVLDELLPIRG